MAESLVDSGFLACRRVSEFGIGCRWPIHRSGSAGCRTRTPSPGSVRSPGCAACSAIRRSGSSLSFGAQKTLCGDCGRVHRGWYDRRVRRVRDLSCGDTRVDLEVEVRRVDCRSCGHVKRERLEFLADNPFYTKRFAFYVGRRCRQATIKDIAQELKLHWDTVKTLEMQYMRAQLAKAGKPGPKAIGIVLEARLRHDEISIRKGHMIRRRPIWFGGDDRSEASMAQFYDWLGESKASGIRLAVMDMWKPFTNATRKQAPQAAILYDKFHIMRHLGEALDLGSASRNTRGSAARAVATSRARNTRCCRAARTSRWKAGDH